MTIMRAKMEGQVVDTGLKRLWTAKAGTGSPLWIPMTGAINTTLVKEVRQARWLEAVTPKFLARLAYEMSDDGVTWSGTVTGTGSYLGTEGWLYNDTSTLLSVTTDQRLFVRFGAQTANDTGSSDVEHALARMLLASKPVVGGTLAAAEQLVFSQGTTTRIFHPLVGPVSIADVGEHRASLKLESGSGDVDVIPAFQVSNDGVTWSDGEGGGADSFSTFGSSRSSAGTDYGTTFTTFAPTNVKRLVRWGAGVKNSSAGKNETGLVSLRIDHRRTT
ncbi:MAG: hypothetical protein H6738_05245 [Alphaproteobacteria bacterium]|nr:hypothetical protein [Alphaproteobacteria bacterium]